ncbi:MAG: AAA family ATPase, partial [Solirubrobacteraceae bacterium]
MTPEGIANAARHELVEREIQLGQLGRAIGQARDGAGTVIYVQGAAGTGRSRLLTAAAELAQDAGLQVLSATGRGLERDFPFGVALQLLEPAWHAQAVDRPDRNREAAPDLMGLLGSVQSFDATNGTDRFATVHRLFALIRELALGPTAGGRGGLAIVVDDAHRADRLSLELLAYLAARIADLPIALLAAVCDGVTPRDSPGLRALSHAPNAVHVGIDALSVDGVATLVRTRLPGATRELCDAFAAATAGNPYLLVEVLREARRLDLDVRDGADRIGRLCPPAVVRSVRARLADLPTEATRLADALAAIGEPASVERAAAIAQLDGAVAAGMAGALAAAGVLRAGLPLAPASPLVAAAIRASIPPAEWEQLQGHASEHHRPAWPVDDPRTIWPEHGLTAAGPPTAAQQPSPTPAQRLALAE